jgi:hypothetical protein
MRTETAMDRHAMRSAMLPDAPERPGNAFTRFLDAAGTGIGDAYRSFMETPDRMRQQIYDYQVSQGVSPDMAALRADRIAGRAGLTTGAVDLMVPQTASDVVLSAAGPLGRVAPRAGRAALAAGGAMMGAEPGEAQAIFAGEGARGARNMFWRARDMLQRRYNPEIVHHNTGVFRAPEGRLMFEIDDSAARLRPENLDVSPQGRLSVPMFPKTPLTVGDVLEHPELYARYPQVAQTPLRSTGFNFNIDGAYNPETNKMFLAGGDPAQTRSVLLHEIQHNVQDIEKFAQGGNTQQFLAADHAQIRRQNDQLMRSLQDTFRSEGVDFNPYILNDAIKAEAAGKKLYDYQRKAIDEVKNSPLWDDLKLAIQNDFRLRAAEAEAFRSYQALPGERMARTVEERRDMTAAERRAGGIPRIVD